MTSTRDGVFISYAHADKKALDLLLLHLAPLKRDHNIRVWSDKDLQPGEAWLARIRNELATARVGIILVSKHFLASDFIHSDELPPLLAAAKSEGVKLYILYLGHCNFLTSPLAKLQALNDPKKPLSDLPVTKRDEVMAQLCTKLVKLFTKDAGSQAKVAAKTVTAAKPATLRTKRPTPVAEKSIVPKRATRSKRLSLVSKATALPNKTTRKSAAGKALVVTPAVKKSSKKKNTPKRK